MITKAIIPVAGLATRLLPLSRVVPKELFPLGEKPLVHHILAELKDSGVREVVFVVRQNKKMLSDYFKRSPKKESQTEIDELIQDMEVSYVSQTKPLGDALAVAQAAKIMGQDACFVVYPDDIVLAKTPACAQLAQVFKTSQKPVFALSRVQESAVSAYGIAQVENIARKLFQIKKVVEKPTADAAPSDLAIVGRRVVTPELFDYIKKAKPNKKGEVVLTEVFGDMIRAGKMVYGHELEGIWLDCGTYPGYLKAAAYTALTHPVLGKPIKDFLKTEKLI